MKRVFMGASLGTGADLGGGGGLVRGLGGGVVADASSLQ